MDIKLLSMEDKPIFNNNDIKFKGNIVFLEEVAKKGIVCVRDFLQGGNLLSYEEFLYKIGRYSSAELDHHVIYNALNQNDLTQNVLMTYDFIEKAKELLGKRNKLLRNIIKADDSNQSIGEQFWNRKFEQDIILRYMAVIDSTKEIKLRELMFKIFHNIYPTNFMLQKMKISTSNKCSHCDEIDFIEHYFVTCPRLTDFWRAVLEWIDKEIGIKLSNGTPEKLFGIIKGEKKHYKGKKVETVNHILTIAKFSIIKSNFFVNLNLIEIFEYETSKRQKYL